MSLEGSIKDFGLADILQLISMQKKSGVITVTHKSESTSLHFDNGRLVFATSISGGETMKLGEILIKAGKLTDQNVAETLRIQKDSKERIGNIFVSSGFVSKEDVKEALQQQLMDVIFHVLRWKDGSYIFEPGEIDYDREYQIPVQTDFILMEGSRMVDEWSDVESKIPADNIIYSQTSRGDEVEQLFSLLSRDEVTVYNLIDGNRDLQDIVQISQLGKFDLYRILLTLMLSGLITQTSTSGKDITPVTSPVKESEEGVESIEEVNYTRENNTRLRNAIQIAVLIFIISFILLLFPAGDMIGLSEFSVVSDFLKHQRTENELHSLRRAIVYYYLVNGHMPDSLDVLYNDHFIRSNFTTDEWHHQYIFEIFPGDKSSSDYKLLSKGRDTIAETPDDIF